MTTTDLLSRQVAAEWLTERLTDKNAEQWALWLRNNANQARHATYRIPTESIGRGTFYNIEELTKFVEFERGRQLGSIKLKGRAAEVARAFGLGSTSGSTTGRELLISAIDPQFDEVSGKTLVRMVTDSPLMVYRLEVSQAKKIAAELLEAVAVCEGAVR